MRGATDGHYPRYAVFENVAGIFSSSSGEDFRLVLEEFCKVKRQDISIPKPKNKWLNAGEILGDDFSVAWRVLDAQYFSVPQRRKRIFLVADFNGERAGKILFESEGLSRYSQQGFHAWQKAANSFETGIGTPGGTICVNTQGSSSLTITEEQTGTLVAQDHGNHPAVLQALENSFALSDRGDSSAKVSGTLRTSINKSLCLAPVIVAGFCPDQSSKSRSIGYEEEKSPTLRAGVVPAALLFDNHAQNARYDGPLEASPTITARYGTGGGNTPIIAEPKTFGVSRHAKAAVIAEASPALVAKGPHEVVEPITAFGICAKGSNAMQSDNPNSGFYEATTSRTLDASGGNSLCSNQGGIAVVEAYKLHHDQAQKTDVSTALDCSIGHLSSQQGGMAVVNTDEIYDVRFTSEGTKNARGHCYRTDTSRCLDTDGEDPSGNHGGLAILAIQGSMISRDNENGPNGSGINEDVSFTLNATDRHAVAMPDEATYASTVGSFMHAEKEKANTLMARDYKDPQIVNDNKSDDSAYIVRRLTPTECARLQGFPDWWCDDLAITTPTDEELAFWVNVWAEWNAMNGKKPKTENQVRKWLSSPYSDSESFKLWGNGISLPVVFFVLSGIKWAADKGFC